MSDVETVVVSREALLDGVEVRTRFRRASDWATTVKVRARDGGVVLTIEDSLVGTSNGYPHPRFCNLLPSEARHLAALLTATADAAEAGEVSGEG